MPRRRTTLWLRCWGRVKAVDRAGTWIKYHGGQQTAYPIYKIKYYDHPEVGVDLGELIGKEMLCAGFLEGVEAIVPIPLDKRRMAERGHNQSACIAKGMAYATGLKIVDDLLVRTRPARRSWSAGDAMTM